MAKKDVVDQKRGFTSIILISILLIAGYFSMSAMTNYLFSMGSTKYTRSEEGNNLDQTDVTLDPITIDLLPYLEALLNSDYFQENFDPEFLQEHADDLLNMMESLAGGDFDPNMFDEFDTDALAAVLAMPMFFTFESNPAVNPWVDPEATLFKIAAYDQYNIEGNTFEWQVSAGLDNLANLEYDTGSSSEKMWKMKYPMVIAPEVSTGVPSVAPTPRVMDYTLTTSPYVPEEGPFPKTQLYLGGMNFQASYANEDVAENTNITYELLYDASDYSAPTYYRTNSLPMATYSGSNVGVSACLSGPYDGTSNIPWVTYRSTHSNFNTVAGELDSYPAFIAASNTYEKMEAIIAYVGENFALNYAYSSRPGDTQDPIEWFCGTRQTSYPFEFSALITALARLNGISTRYVSGYNWNEAINTQIETQSGGLIDPDPYPDPSESNNLAYVYRVAHSYTWVEAFIPMSSSAGEWLEFDNQFSTTVPSPEEMDLDYILKFESDYYPDPDGYPRFDGGPKIIYTEVNITFNGAAQNNLDIEIRDVSTNTVLTTITTDSNGIASTSLDISNWVTGPHILNFTSTYSGYEFGNVSIIDVVEPVDIYVTSITPANKLTNNTHPLFNVQGYAWDPALGVPVKNAVINVTVEREDQPGILYTLGEAVSTNALGNFSLTRSMLGRTQGNYTVRTNFPGVFNITQDINLFNPDYRQAMLDGGLAIWPQHAAHVPAYVDIVEIYDLKYTDYNYFYGNFWINNTNTFSTIPLVIVNNNGWLNFTASTWQGTNWVTGEIRVFDLTDPDRGSTNPIVTFFTNPSGNASSNYCLSWEFPDIEYWTVGPHQLRLQWVDSPSPNDPSSYMDLWVFVRGPVYVDEFINVYDSGSGTGGRYFINSNGNGDDVPIGAAVHDSNTGENLTNIRVYYQVRDKNLNNFNTTHLEVGDFDVDITSATVKFHTEVFRFTETVPIENEPYQTSAYFRGEWVGIGGTWNEAWNTLWAPYFGIVADYCTLDPIYLADPENATLVARVDLVRFQDVISTPVKYDGQSVQISCNFVVDGNPIWPSGQVTVRLQDVYNGTTLGTTSTDINGNANFTIAYGEHTRPGAHRYRISVTYTPSFTIYREAYIWVIYNNTMTIDASRTWGSPVSNLTAGLSDTNHRITVTGVLDDIYNKAYLYATIKVWVKQGVFSTLASNVLNFHVNSYDSNTGAFTLTFSAKPGLFAGNYTLVVGFDGTLQPLPDGGPSYSEPYLAVNASAIAFTVYDKPYLTSSYTFYTAAPPPLNSTIIPGVTTFNFTGSLRYSNGSAIANELVSIVLYDKNGSTIYTNNAVLTDGLGNFKIENLPTLPYWNPDYYLVSYTGNWQKNLEAATTITRYI